MKSCDWGGKRDGSGRKARAYQRNGWTIRLTKEEYNAVKPLLEAIRERTDMDYQGKNPSVSG